MLDHHGPMSLLFWLVPLIALSGLITGATALVLRFVGPRQRRFARVLWPIAALLLWSSAWVFLAIAFATDPDNVTSETAIHRLFGPLPVLIISDALGLIWLWSAIRRHRSELHQTGVAA